MSKATVYFTKTITPDSLQRIYQALGVELAGKIGVKISTGEPGGHNYLHPALIGPLVRQLDGTIIECCTAYAGRRMDPKEHWQAIREHGFQDMAPCDLLDEFGELTLPVRDGFHLKKNIVGDHFRRYDSILVLSHFKGHAMGGFGGALKNISIGLASTRGKTRIHTAGVTDQAAKLFDNLPPQDHFLESMADACRAVIEDKGAQHMLYINVANRLSIDCDCDANPAEPEMADLGIFASADPVAVDQACYDAVVNAPDPGKKALVQRMEQLHGIHTVEAAAQHGLGSREYEIVTLD